MFTKQASLAANRTVGDVTGNGHMKDEERNETD
jgi:hypothetical protein